MDLNISKEISTKIILSIMEHPEVWKREMDPSRALASADIRISLDDSEITVRNGSSWIQLAVNEPDVDRIMDIAYDMFFENARFEETAASVVACIRAVEKVQKPQEPSNPVST